jgi:hypothetical protein
LPGLVDTSAVVAIDDEDKALCAREVMTPERSDLVLPTNIPDIEFDVLVCDGFDVEADSGDCSDVLIELELVENR